MSLPPGCKCDPEEVFALADQALTPQREHEMRNHVSSCPECRALYEKETQLNSCLKSLDFSGACSVRERVVMALPTRPLKVRLLWALLSGSLLLLALFALALNGVNPATFLMGSMEIFWSTTAMLTDLLDTAVSIAGGTILAALAVGAFLDLLLVTVLLSVSRRRAREI